MGTGDAGAVRLRRPRWRSYLLLARVSNLPTIWTNVLAGMVASSVSPDWPTFLRVAASISLFYTGGMFLNDAFDHEFDGRSRPDRPLPAADVTLREVFGVAGVMLVTGELLLLAPNLLAAMTGLLLATAIVYYDYQHKGSRIAPLVMGVCRGLVYCIAAIAVSHLSSTAVIGAVVISSYVAGLTVVAKVAGANARWLVPVLIAGISLVDAVFIAMVSSSGSLALAAACGFLLTLLLQRFVPGD